MRSLRLVVKASETQNGKRFRPILSALSRSFSNQSIPFVFQFFHFHDIFLCVYVYICIRVVIKSCNCWGWFSRASFGIAFDIDGVVLRGETPIGGSPQALTRLYRHDSGPTFLLQTTLLTNFLFLFLYFLCYGIFASFFYLLFVWLSCTGALKIPYILLTNGEFVFGFQLHQKWKTF